MKRAQYRRAFDVGHPGIAVRDGALEPGKGGIRLASGGVHYGDLDGRVSGVFCLELRKRRVGFLPPAGLVVHVRETGEARPLGRLELTHSQCFGISALVGKEDS